MIDFFKLVVVPDDHASVCPAPIVVASDKGHDLISKEQLCLLDTAHVEAFKLTLERAGHEDAEAVLVPDCDATVVLVECHIVDVIALFLLRCANGGSGSPC